MNTTILLVNTSDNTHSYRVNDSCCEHLKGSSYAGKFNEAFVTHPSGYSLIAEAQKFIDLMNLSIPYFDVEIISVVEFRKLLKIKKMSLSTDPLKKNASAFLTERGSESPIYHIKLDWENYPGFVNILTPVTMLRFTLANADVRHANAPLVEILNTYQVEDIHFPALLKVLDHFHDFYKSSSNGFATTNINVVCDAYRGNRSVGGVTSFFDSIVSNNRWYRAQRAKKFFNDFVISPFGKTHKTLSEQLKNDVSKIKSGKMSIIPIYEKFVELHNDTEKRILRIGVDGCSDEKKQKELLEEVK